jgi:hypothetical protein
MRYLFTCGLLILPAAVWNIVFAARLPPAFQAAEFDRDVPGWLMAVENGARLLVFLLPFAMPLELTSGIQRTGAVVFAVGTTAYFASWLPLMLTPASPWSRSRAGFLGPGYTPALWLAGIALIGRSLFFTDLYRSWMYAAAAVVFLAAHLAHANIAFGRARRVTSGT